MSDDKNVSQTIDELYSVFSEQLNEIGAKIGFNNVLMQSYADWQNDNIINLIYGSLYARSALKEHTLESFLVHLSPDPVPHSDDTFSKKLDRYYAKRPHGMGRAFAMVTGQLAESEENFLQKFKERGEALIAEAEETLQNRENEFAAFRALQWSKLHCASSAYEKIVQGIADRDLSAILEALRGEDMHGVEPEIKAQLFIKPINEYGSVLSAIISITRQTHDADHLASNMGVEKEIIIEIVENLRSNPEAIESFLSEVSLISDQEIQGHYRGIIATCFYDDIVKGLTASKTTPQP